MIIKNSRAETVKKVEQNYKGQYGEYKYYAGQAFVFKQGNKVNKTLLLQEADETYFQRSFLKFDIRPVHKGDNEKQLKEVIKGWKEEWNWYYQNFKDIKGIKIPKETYSICKDPMGTDNKTVLVSSEWIENIKGDIFRIEAEKLYQYIAEYPKFKQTLTQLIQKFLELSKENIYPDYLGTDNIAIYTKDHIPHIAIIDPHIVWTGTKYSKDVERRLNSAIERFNKFLENPTKLENIVFLTKEGMEL